MARLSIKKQALSACFCVHPAPQLGLEPGTYRWWVQVLFAYKICHLACRNTDLRTRVYVNIFPRLVIVPRLSGELHAQACS